MKLIVGLGNPGEKYEHTRHNVGFMVVDRFLKDFKSAEETVWDSSEKFKSEMAKIEWKPKVGPLEEVLLLKPFTHMNASGMSVSLVKSFYKIQPEEIWVVHDEVDLPLGTMKIRLGGGSAGHKGIESLLKELGTDKFYRFRMGIGGPHSTVGTKYKEIKSKKVRDIDDFVLGTFGRGESGKVKDLLKRGANSLSCALEESIESSMNQFNSK